jgi:hypothetical protein
MNLLEQLLFLAGETMNSVLWRILGRAPDPPFTTREGLISATLI